VKQAAGARSKIRQLRPGLAVAARVAGRHVALDRRVAQAPDELAGAEVLVAVGKGLHHVAQRAQALRRGPGMRLDVDDDALR
jgi:hypothetical protein